RPPRRRPPSRPGPRRASSCASRSAPPGRDRPSPGPTTSATPPPPGTTATWRSRPSRTPSCWLGTSARRSSPRRPNAH
ncbi:MAG: hypothetical protein AVDCRST_MAG48-83, partial [uncultured Friedmanniella sp.]